MAPDSNYSVSGKRGAVHKALAVEITRDVLEQIERSYTYKEA